MRTIITCSPRTGSNLLLFSLGLHDGAKNAGELGNHLHEPPYKGPDWNLAKLLSWYSDRDWFNSVFIDSFVIYLYREDREAQLASWEKACKTGIWAKGQPPQKAEWDSRAAEEQIELAGELFHYRADMVISYERMVDYWDETIENILLANRWPATKLEQATQKQ